MSSRFYPFSRPTAPRTNGNNSKLEEGEATPLTPTTTAAGGRFNKTIKSQALSGGGSGSSSDDTCFRRGNYYPSPRGGGWPRATPLRHLTVVVSFFVLLLTLNNTIGIAYLFGLGRARLYGLLLQLGVLHYRQTIFYDCMESDSLMMGAEKGPDLSG